MGNAASQLAPESVWFGVLLAPVVAALAVGVAGAAIWPKRLAAAALGLAAAMVGMTLLSRPGQDALWPIALGVAAVGAAASIAALRASGHRFATDRQLFAEGAKLWPDPAHRFEIRHALLFMAAAAAVFAAGRALNDAQVGVRTLSGVGFFAAILVGLAAAAVAMLGLYAASATQRFGRRILGAVVLTAAVTLFMEWAVELLLVIDERDNRWSMRAYQVLKAMSGAWWRWSSALLLSSGGVFAALRLRGYRVLEWAIE